MIRPLLLAAAAILPLLAAIPAEAKAVLATVPIARLDLHWWRERFDAKQHELHSRDPRLVFYGDSIMQFWERSGPPAWQDFAPVWQRYYGDRNAVNLGFKGDTTSSLIWRLDHGEAEGIHPKVAVILIGANNLGRLHWSAGDTVQGIETIIGRLRQHLPQTKLLLLSVLPSDRGEWAEQTRANVNRALSALYGSGAVPNVTWLDVTGLFLKDGKVDPAAYLDPRLSPPEKALHPDAPSAARLFAAMEPTLSHMLGDRDHRLGVAGSR